MHRHLYLVAYDVADPQRLARVLNAVKAWRAAGQKSVAECWMTPGERDRLAGRLAGIIDSGSDRLHILRLDPRQQSFAFGIARTATRRPFMIG